MLNAKLVVVGGEADSTEIRLKTLPSTLGRGRDATVTLAHPLISRQHCEIFESDGRLMVRDLGSLNGTFVGSQRITEAKLPPGELLTIGAVTFRAVYGAQGEQPAAEGAAGKTTDTVTSDEVTVPVSPPPSSTPIAEEDFIDFDEVEELAEFEEVPETGDAEEDVEEVEAVEEVVEVVPVEELDEAEEVKEFGEIEAVEDVEGVEDIEDIEEFEEIEDVEEVADIEDVEPIDEPEDVEEVTEAASPKTPPSKAPAITVPDEDSGTGQAPGGDDSALGNFFKELG